MGQAQVFSNSMASIGTPIQSKLRLYLPSEIQSIEKASSDRYYKAIKGLNGKDVPMCGALIPEKYDLDRTVPGYPWICPIRSCRRVFKKIVSLGPHFIVCLPCMFWRHEGQILTILKETTRWRPLERQSRWHAVTSWILRHTSTGKQQLTTSGDLPESFEP